MASCGDAWFERGAMSNDLRIGNEKGAGTLPLVCAGVRLGNVIHFSI